MNLLFKRMLTEWIDCRPESLQLLTHSLKDGSVAIFTVGRVTAIAHDAIDYLAF